MTSLNNSIGGTKELSSRIRLWYNTIKLIPSYTRIRYAFVMLGIVSLFVNYKLNISDHLFDQKLNNYLDFVVSSTDLFIIASSALFVFLKYKYAQIATLVLYLPIAVYMATDFDGQVLWQWLLTFSRLAILAAVAYELVRNNSIPRVQKIVYSTGLCIIALFDHYLISEPLFTTILFVSYLFVSTPKSDYVWYESVFRGGISGWYGLNLVTSIYQITTGTSLGLRYIGETFQDVTMVGFAKQIIPFSEHVLLRPAGLTLHPNHMAGISLLGIFFATQKYFASALGWGRYVVLIASSITFVLAMSRAAYLAFGVGVVVFVVVSLYESDSWFTLIKQKSYTLLACIGFLVAGFGVFFLSITRLDTSDVYRGRDISTYIQVVSELSLQDVIFGLGLGRYPIYLFERGGLNSWEYLPVHSLPLYLIISIGVVPGALLIVSLVTLSKRHIKTNLKKYLYVQWYDSGNPQRNNELLETLKHNIKCGEFDSILLFYDSEESLELIPNKYLTSLITIPITSRLTYQMIADYAYMQEEHIVVLANSDIRFDTSMSAISKLLDTQSVIAISRYEEDGALMPDGRGDYLDRFYSQAQDTWCWYSTLRIKNAVFELGIPQCENRFALSVVRQGFRILNPYDTIITKHTHGSEVRSYSKDTKYHTGYLLFPTIYGEYSVIHH
jgi:hypothetical protein